MIGRGTRRLCVYHSVSDKNNCSISNNIVCSEYTNLYDWSWCLMDTIITSHQSRQIGWPLSELYFKLTLPLPIPHLHVMHISFHWLTITSEDFWDSPRVGNEWANDTQESMPFALCVGTEKQTFVPLIHAPKSLFALHTLFSWSAIPIAQWYYKSHTTLRWILCAREWLSQPPMFFRVGILPYRESSKDSVAGLL